MKKIILLVLFFWVCIPVLFAETYCFAQEKNDEMEKYGITGRKLHFYNYFKHYGQEKVKEYVVYTRYKNNAGRLRTMGALCNTMWSCDPNDVLEGRINAGEKMCSYYFLYNYPPDYKGTGVLCWQYVQPEDPDPSKWINSATWIYFPSLRRVRRLAVSDTSDNLEGGTTTYDDVNVHNINWMTHKIVAEDFLSPEEIGVASFGKGKYTTGAGGEVKLITPDVPFYTKPLKCWVVENVFQVPDYYLSRRYMWFSQDLWGDGTRHIRPVREEQYDREGRLCKIFEYGYKPINGLAQYFDRNIHNLMINFRDLIDVIETSAGPKLPNIEEYYNTPDYIRKERFWKDISYSLKMGWNELSIDKWPSAPPLLKDKLPTLQRKIELPAEIKEKILKEIEER